MKTAKEVARELHIEYGAFKGFLRVMRFPKPMGTYRFRPRDIENVRVLLEAGLLF